MVAVHSSVASAGALAADGEGMVEVVVLVHTILNLKSLFKTHSSFGFYYFSTFIAVQCSVASAGALAGAADGDRTEQNLDEARLQVKTTEVLATQLMNIKLAQLEQVPQP